MFLNETTKHNINHQSWRSTFFALILCESNENNGLLVTVICHIAFPKQQLVSNHRLLPPQ